MPSTVLPREAAPPARRRSVTRGTVYYFLGSFLPTVIALLAVPILLSSYGSEKYGLLTLSWTLLAYFGLLDLGLGTAITQAAASVAASERSRRFAGILWRVLALSGLVATGIGVICWISANWIAQSLLRIPPRHTVEMTSILRVLALSVPIVVSSSVLRGFLEGQRRFGLANIFRLATAVISYVAPLISVVCSRDIAFAVNLVVWGRAGLLGALLIVCRPALCAEFSCSYGPRDGLLQLLRFGGWSSVTNFVSPFMVSMDRFLIVSLLALSPVAYYSTAQQIGSQLLVLPGAVGAVLFPELVVRLAQEPRGAHELYRRATRLCLACVIAPTTFLLIYGRDILSLWLGANAAGEIVPALRWVLVGATFNSIAQVPFSALRSFGRPDLPAKLHLIELPAYVAAVWALTAKFGVQGAAAAWCFRAVADSLFLGWGIRELRGWTWSIRGVVASLAILTVCFACYVGLLTNSSTRVMVGLPVAASSILLTWRGILSSSDHRAIAYRLRQITLLSPVRA